MAGNKGQAAEVGGVTVAQVSQMIAAALAVGITPEQLNTAMLALREELAKGAEVHLELVGRVETLEEILPRLQTAPPVQVVEDASPEFDPAWIEGLTYSGARSEKKVIDGRPRLVPVSYQRPLQARDVLSFRVDDEAGRVILVTADGRKYTLDI